MAQLYPPNISGTIPAFCKPKNGTSSIDVPFTMNKAVTRGQISGFILHIKKIDGTSKLTLSINLDTNDPIIPTTLHFTISENDLLLFNVGEFYKVQLAYKDLQGIVGIYSTVGVIKCTASPSVSIDLLTATDQSNNIVYNNRQTEYSGIYANKEDPTEQLYAGYFTITAPGANGSVVYQSKPKIFNNALSTSNTSIQTEIPEVELANDVQGYKIQYCVTTINGLTAYSPQYYLDIETTDNLENPETINPSVISGMSNSDMGTVDLNIDFIQIDPSRQYLVWRKTLFTQQPWQLLATIEAPIELKEYLYQDYTVEHHTPYLYKIQEKQGNKYFKPIYINQSTASFSVLNNNAFYVDFEDILLYDGEKQLKLKFNPQISTFQRHINATKIETLGGAYPFVIRNGNMKYAEIPLSCLLTYHMDDMYTFIANDQEIGLQTKERNMNTTAANIKAERLFKNAVVDWLNNGQLKLLRTPAEGNFIVSLMNVSLSPNAQFSRMLATLTCNAYEMMDYNIKNLQQHHLQNTTLKSVAETTVNERTLSRFFQTIEEDTTND